MAGTVAPPREDLGELIARFRRDGFVLAPGVISATEVDSYGSAVDAAVAARKLNDRRRLEEKTPYEQSFIQCEYLWEDFPAVRGLTFHPRIAGLAAALLGAAKVRIWHDQALYKEPGGRETDAHQDYGYWPLAEPDAITAWTPLVDIDESIGCMGYFVGTQTTAREFVDIFRAPGSGKSVEARHSPPVYVPAKAGDVIFHHARTLHLAKPNASSRMRRVYTCIYFRDGCTRGDTPKHHPSVDRDAVGIGAVVAGGATPIAWPLEHGRMPEPTPWPHNDSARYRAAVELGVLPQA
jgi:hypothetical protein